MTNLPKSASPSEAQPEQERLSHASGALSDIATFVTDCVSKSDPPRMHEICEAILERILTSADRPRTRPSWFRHDWEKSLWERYESGELKACASDKSCKTLAATAPDSINYLEIHHTDGRVKVWYGEEAQGRYRGIDHDPTTKEEWKRMAGEGVRTIEALTEKLAGRDEREAAEEYVAKHFVFAEGCTLIRRESLIKGLAEFATRASAAPTMQSFAKEMTEYDFEPSLELDKEQIRRKPASQPQPSAGQTEGK